MKKTLLTLGVLAAMTFVFASCGDEDCTCTASMEVNGTYVDAPNKLEKNGVDDCDDLTAKDFPMEDEETGEVEYFDKVTCEKK